MMNWQQLLCADRLQRQDAKHDPGRSPFQQDLDRIVFSSSFRRLAHKTQVHPLTENDHVHTRLTHSIEVASVGRSLGANVGMHIASNQPSLNVSPDAFGYIVQAACLAHDIGNPPFGHSGEEALSAWFREYFDSKDGMMVGRSLGNKATDFTKFEGNAQGFRILTRLENNRDAGGLQLTHAVIGTFLKYPRLSISGDSKYVGHKKFSSFIAEEEYLREVACKCGLLIRGAYWSRHPLSFLVEAADDICYGIVDIEDGFELGNLAYSEACAILEPIAGALDKKDLSEPDVVAKLRAVAIGKMVTAVAEVFRRNEENILDGTFNRELISETSFAECIRKAKDVARERIYQSNSKVKLELAGYEIIWGLLTYLVPVAIELDKNDYDINLLPDRQKKYNRLISPNGLRGVKNMYEALLRITDFISGMTDRYALSMYRNLKGISLQNQ
ncbi:MAG: deoxyguanosinetriphosphate triphosphohydrolase [Rhodospirillales bacterium]|nr:deoxyguanosinetriphosphate triphosphohydrolase [Rhodospirillales bacterium]